MAESDIASRQRLRPWLIALINRNDIPGLCWLNAERTKFKIPWKHAGKQDWNPSDSQIFVEWAKQTGSYREGVDRPDYVKWKTRLRCALNKAQDIEYLEHESQTQDDCPEQYRVYELKPRYNGKKKGKGVIHCGDSIPDQPTTGQLLLNYESSIPRMVTELNDELGGRLPSDLRNLNSSELRAFGDAAPISVNSSLLASMPSVTMTSHNDISFSAVPTCQHLDVSFDVQQLADSMNSITFDQATLSSTDNSQKTTGFVPPEDHPCDPRWAASGQHVLGGPHQAGQIMFSCANTDDTTLMQTPVTLASTLGVQPITFQLSPTASSHEAAMAEPALNDYCSEEFNCSMGLQDMLVGSEEF